MVKTCRYYLLAWLFKDILWRCSPRKDSQFIFRGSRNLLCVRNLFHFCLHSKSNFHYGPSCSIISKAWLCMSSVGFFTMRSVFFLYLKGSQCNGKNLFLSLHHLFFWSCIFTIKAESSQEKSHFKTFSNVLL